MKLRILPALSFFGLVLAASTPAAEPTILKVWPGKPPGENAEIGPEKDTTKPTDRTVADKPVKRIGNVSEPTISIFRPAKEIDTGAAVIIAPGGGYNILAWDLEGEEVATWLNSIGVTGIVLKYRVPRRPDQARDKPPIHPLQDAQRAMSVVRSQAKELGIDPKRIGMLGFSAGGHLTAATSTNYDKRAYTPIDDIDKVSCRPDFAILVYPGYLVQKGTTDLNADIRVTSETPPCFFAHAANDGVEPENSIGMFLALKKAKVPSELHIFSTGGHGFGLRSTDVPCTKWPKKCEEWLRIQGILKKG